MGRLLALTDGVFAFAITLLVIQLVIPVCTGNGTEDCVVRGLQKEIPGFLAYLFTFYIIGIWWMRHNSAYHYIVRYDPTLLWVNLVFLLTIAVTPFVLGVFAEYSSDQIALVLFGLVQAAAGALLYAMWWYAARAKLLSSEADDRVVSYHQLRGTIVPIVFVAAAGLAFVSVLASTVALVSAGVASAVLRRF